MPKFQSISEMSVEWEIVWEYCEPTVLLFREDEEAERNSFALEGTNFIDRWFMEDRRG